MKALTISIVVIAALIGVSAIILFNRSDTPPQVTQTTSSTTPQPEEKVDIKTSFTIITGSITRSFKAEKYHNLSPDVYIEASDPTIAHVKKAGITWDDFFKTLPMKLTKECLTTGDGETFCNGKDGSLKFYLNDSEEKDLLDKEIKDGDKAFIKFISS